MAVTGWKAPGTAANIDRDSMEAWVNVNNALVDDGTPASCDCTKLAYSDWLSLTNYGFTNSDISGGSTIDGIEVSVQRWAETNLLQDSAIYLRKTEGIVGSNYASATNWPTSEGSATYGGATDKWGTTWTQSDIVSSDFGIDLSGYNGNFLAKANLYVDVILIRVYYTPSEKTLTETATISSSVKATVAAKTLSSLITISETLLNTFMSYKEFTSDITVSDVCNKTISITLSESVDVADSTPTWQYVASRTFTETIYTSPNWHWNLEWLQTCEEEIVNVDDVIAGYYFAKSLTEEITVSDDIENSRGKYLALSESVGTSDNETSYGTAWHITLSDGITVADSRISSAISCLIVNSITISDTLGRSSVRSRTLTSDNITISDDCANNVEWLIECSETISFVEDVYITGVRWVTLFEDITVGDVKYLEPQIDFSETINITSAIPRDIVLVALSETISPNDGVQEWLNRLDNTTAWTGVASSSDFWTVVPGTSSTWTTSAGTAVVWTPVTTATNIWV